MRGKWSNQCLRGQVWKCKWNVYEKASEMNTAGSSPDRSCLLLWLVSSRHPRSLGSKRRITANLRQASRCSLATPPDLKGKRAEAGAHPGHSSRARRSGRTHPWTHPRGCKRPGVDWAPEPGAGNPARGPPGQGSAEMLEKSIPLVTTVEKPRGILSVNWAGDGKILTVNSGGTHAGFQEETRAEAAGAQGPSPCTGRVGLEFSCVWGRPSGRFQIQTSLNDISVHIFQLLYNTHTRRQESKWGRKQRGSKTWKSYQVLLLSQPRHSQQYINPSHPRWAGGTACAGHASWINACVRLFQGSEASVSPILIPSWPNQFFGLFLKTSISSQALCHNRWDPGGDSFSHTPHRETLQWTFASLPKTLPKTLALRSGGSGTNILK